MQSYENDQRKRKSKSNAYLHMPRFGRFTRFSRWMPKILSTLIFAILDVLAAGFNIISKPIIYRNPTKPMNINAIPW